MTTLFPLPELQKLQRPISKFKCKTCKHCGRWACGGSYFFYCGARKSKRTNNGFLKIKANQEACSLHTTNYEI